MYRFNKVKDEDGAWRFELSGINLLIDDFFIKDGKHWIKNPTKAIAYFNIGGHLYGVANQIITFTTVEEFYDTMLEQYRIFKRTNLLNNHINQTPVTTSLNRSK